MMRSRQIVVGLLVVVATGCGAAERRNIECSWPLESSSATLDLTSATDRRHLDGDALLAEDLAIRYADHAKGPRSGQRWERRSYHAAREQCMAALFGAVARSHGVPEPTVREAVDHRSPVFDAGVLLVFTFVYGLAASAMAKQALQRFDGAAPGMAVAILVGSIALGVVGFLVGDIWSGLAETIRIGNTHISYRVNRVPWRQYPEVMFGACIGLSWLLGAYRYHAQRSGEPTNGNGPVGHAV